MTDHENAERMRHEYLTRPQRKTVVNICTARPNWNGCDYCDMYSGAGLECWKQNAAHACVRCVQRIREAE